MGPGSLQGEKPTAWQSSRGRTPTPGVGAIGSTRPPPFAGMDRRSLLFEEADTSGDGRVDLAEFKRILDDHEAPAARRGGPARLFVFWLSHPVGHIVQLLVLKGS